MAGAVFATSFLAPIVGWQIGPRRSTALSGLILGLTTLLATLSRNNLLDLALTTVGLAAGMWWLGLLHSSRAADRPSPLPVALPVAFVGDVALRSAFRTLPVVDARSEERRVGKEGRSGCARRHSTQQLQTGTAT